MGFILKAAVLVLLGLVAMLGYIWFKNANALNSEQLTYYQDMKNKYENELKGFHH